MWTAILSCGGCGWGSDQGTPPPSPPPPSTVVAFGTSLTYTGIAPLLQAHEEELNITVYNMGYSGYDCIMLLPEFPAALALKPKVILIETAMNDAYYALTMDEVEGALKEMIRQAKEHGVRVILMTTNPAPSRPTLPAYYDMYRIIAILYDVDLIDMEPLWVDYPPEYIPDGIHPTVEGLEVMCWPEIKEAF